MSPDLSSRKELLEAFLEAQPVEPKTRELYRKIVGGFLAGASDEVFRDRLAAQNAVVKFIARLRTGDGRRKAKSYQALQARVLRLLFGYLLENELVSFDLRDFTSGKAPKRIKERHVKSKIIRHELLAPFLDFIEKEKPKYGLVLKLMYSCASRPEEVVGPQGFSPDNIIWDENTIFLEKSKAGGNEFMFFTEDAEPLKERLREFIQENKRPQNRPVFEEVDYEALRKFSRRALKRYMEDGGILKTLSNQVAFSPGMLRHSRAYRLMKQGRKPEELKVIMRHESYDVTEKYYLLGQEKEIIDKLAAEFASQENGPTNTAGPATPLSGQPEMFPPAGAEVAEQDIRGEKE